MRSSLGLYFVLTKKRQAKRLRGATITELLVVSLLMTFSLAVLGEAMGLLTLTSSKFSNKANAIDVARNAIRKISADVRQSRFIGDYFGDSYLAGEKRKFPSSQNPIYGSVGAIPVPAGGWPWGTVPYILSSDCLIIQIPMSYLDRRNDPNDGLYNKDLEQNPLNGFPFIFKPNSTEKYLNLTTVVYKVVASPSDPNSFQLQVARFPGYPMTLDPSVEPTSYPLSITEPPQVVVTDLIGPMNSAESTLPVVFTFYRKVGGALVKVLNSELDDPAIVNSIIGVGIDMEFSKSAAKTDKNSQKLGIHTESFSRSNRYLQLRN